MRTKHLITLLFTGLFASFAYNQSLDLSQFNSTDEYQEAKQNLIHSNPFQNQNLQDPRSYPEVTTNENRAGACWYPLDGSFTTLCQNGSALVALNGGSLDDGFWGPIALGFNFTLYGTTYTDLYINTNGNISFGGGYTAFTAAGFPDAAGPDMIAPFWSDVDVRGVGIDNSVSYYIDAVNEKIVIIWNEVGYYNSNITPTNTFQLLLSSGTDPWIGVGDNAQFAYDDMNWAVGGLSGTNGFGAGNYGTAGAQNATGANFYQIGLFEFDDASYDGAAGANDGIHYLDNGCFITDISGLNTPPIASGFPSSTVQVCEGATYNVSTTFSAPETAQTTTTVVTNSTLDPGSWSTTITNGNLSSIDFTLTPIASDVGTHTITYTATDDGTPIESSVETITIEVLAAPTPTISGSTSFCTGGSSLLDAGAGFVSYAWTPNSETSQTVTASAAGVYTVTVTDGNGCSGSDSETITINADPTPSITPSGATSFCPGGSITLDAGSYTSYSWSPNSETSQIVTASAAATYTVTVTDANGCTGSDSEIITVFTNPTPSITPSGATTFCDGSSITLDAGNGYSTYAWTPNSESTSTVNAAASGTYSVTVTDGNGCSGSDSEVITVNTNPTPSITPSGSTTFCDGGSVTLDAGSYTSYLWTLGSETTQTIAPTTSGSYEVTVTDANGCIGTDTEVITVNPNPTALVTPSGATTFCAGGTVDLIASGGTSYSWSPTLETTNTITVTTSGTHTVTVTDGNGCTDTDNATVTVNTNPTPSITPSSATTFCDGGSVTLDAGSYISYLWTIGSETTQTIAPSTSGSYEVTVTDANGCTGTDTEIVTVNTNPTASIAGSSSYCTGFSSTLDAGSGYSAYLWSNTASTQTSSFTTADNPITVTVTDANGCTDTSPGFTLTENSALTPVVSGPTAYCAGSNSTLDAGAGYVTYSWSNSASTQTSTFTSADNPITVTVTDANGCSGTSAATNLTENTNPTPSISGPTDYCTGNTALLDAGSFSSYVWSTTATTQTINATTADNPITVTVTDANGCSGITSAVSLTENSNPTPSITGTLDYCAGNTATLDAGSGYTTYVWSNTDATQTSTFTNADNPISVTVTDANGCSTTSSSVVVTENALPTPSISGTLTYCAGNSALLDAGTYTSYIWSTTATTQTINATTADNNLSVTVTDANGCSNTSASVTVVENSNPTPVITGTLSYCAGNSTTLTATTGFSSYSWSPGSQTTESITATAGSYDVTVVDGNGCTGTSASVTVIENALPTPVITGTLDYCAGNTTTLDAGTGYTTYSWSNTDITQTSVVSAGSFSVTVVDGNGCSGTSPSVTVIENALPTPTITGTLDYCAGGNTTLDAGAGYSTYNWSNSDISQTSIVTSGTYDVTVVDGNGCSGTSPSVAVIENANPTPSITGSATYCNGGSSSLSADVGFISYSWNSSETTQSIAAVEANNPFNVTVIDANGCTGTSANFSVTETLALSPSVLGSTEYCTSDGSLMLNSDAGYTSYSWSNGETTQSGTFTTADNPISVTVFDANGCTGTSPNVTITENSNPTPTITGALDYCFGDSTLLDAGTYSSYAWDNGETSQTTYSMAGTINVIVTDANGCTGTNGVTVTENALPTPTITGSLTYCSGSNTTLDAGVGFSSYTWSNLDVTQTSTVNAGTYDVTVIDVNGCEGTSPSVTVTEFTAPSPVIYGSTTFCSGGSTNLNTDSYTTYLWSNSDATQSTNITSAGSYTVTVTDANGCISTSAPVTVTVNTFLTPNLSGSLDYCETTTATLDPGAGYSSYSWSTGATSQTLSATEADNPISVTVVDGNGCSGTTSPVSVTERPNPTPVITGDLEYCNGSDVTLDAGSGYATYLWSNAINTQTNTVNAGAFAVTVSTAYGCMGLSPAVNVVEHANPTPVVTGDNDYCSGSTVILDAGANYSTYNWSNGASIQTTSAPSGTYNVTVVDTNNCTGTSPDHVVTEYPTPAPTISGQDSICDGETSTLDAGSGYDSYVWSNSMGGQQVAITSAGSYNVVVTNSFGCSNVSPFFEITVLANPIVNVSNSGDEVFCDSTAININLDAGTHVSYVWNTTETTQTINVTSTGSYNVTVTNSDGCSTLSDDLDIIASTLTSPVLQLDGDTTFCEGDQAELYVNDDFYTYEWSSGSTTPTIIANHSDDYWVTVSDEYGCTKQSDTITVIVDEAPIANFNFSSPNMTIDFTDNSSNASSWTWDFDDTTTGATQNPSHTYATSGSYFVTLVVSNACGTDEITQQVNVKPVDNISVNELIWSDLDVYPNPSEGIIFINVNEIKSSPIQITVLDELGAVVLNEYLNNTSNQIDLNHVATGVYFVKIQLEDSQLTRKILIH